jgi:hypothetical protein
MFSGDTYTSSKLVLLWAQLTKIYPPLPTSVQPISITKTLLIVPTKNERDPPLDNMSSVSQNVLKFYQQLTGEERRIPFIFDDFHFCHSRVIGLDMMENRIFTLHVYVVW